MLRTVLELDMEGEEGSTRIEDAQGHVMTAVGDACLSRTDFKTDEASLLLQSSGSWVETAGGRDFAFKDGDFTVECFIRTSAARAQVVVDFYQPGQSGWKMELNAAGKLVWCASSAIATGVTPLCDGEWHHIAVTRQENVLRLFVDGQLETTKTDNTDYRATPVKLAIGAQVSSRSSAYDFAGYIDDVRITRHQARYIEAFDPPGGTAEGG